MGYHIQVAKVHTLRWRFRQEQRSARRCLCQCPTSVTQRFLRSPRLGKLVVMTLVVNPRQAGPQEEKLQQALPSLASAVWQWAALSWVLLLVASWAMKLRALQVASLTALALLLVMLALGQVALPQMSANGLVMQVISSSMAWRMLVTSSWTFSDHGRP